MKEFYCLVTVVFPTFLMLTIGHAQQEQAKMDSLQRILQTAKEDTNKVNTLNNLAREIKNTNPDSAIFISTQALHLAEKIKWQTGIGKSHFDLGSFFYHKSDYPLAFEHLSKALAIWEQLERSDISHKLQIMKLESSTLGNLGLVYWRQGDFSKALTYFLKSLKLDEELGNKKGAVVELGDIGIIYQQQGDYPQALDYFFKTLKIDEELEDREGIAMDLGNIGTVYDSKANYPKALDYFLKALKMTEELGDKNGTAAHLGSIGIIYMEQGDYPKALDYYFKALRMAEEMKDKNGISQQISNIGTIYYQQGDYSKALDYFLKSLKMHEELGDKEALANDIGNIGNVFISQANYAKALDNFFRALKITEELGDKNGIAKNFNSIGCVYEEQGDYSAALKYYFKELKIEEDLGDKQGQALSLGNIGSLYIDQNKLKEADKFLHNALTLATEIKALDLVKLDNENLSRLYSKEGNYKQSLEHYKLYIAAKDILNNEEKAKNQTRLEMNYEFAKQQDSLKAVQDKKDMLANAEIVKQKIIRNSIAGGAGILALLMILLIVYAVRRFRRIKAEEEEKLKEELDAVLHDGLRKRLALIQNNSDLMLGQLSRAEKEKATRTAQDISAITQGALFNMEQLTSDLGYEQIAFSEIINHFSRYINLSNAETINFKIDFEEIDHAATLKGLHVRHLYLVFEECINNLLKHAECKNVFINMRLHDSTLRLEIRDDGKGFEMSKLTRKNGLNHIQDRVAKIKGKAIIFSRPGEGCLVTIKMPCT